MPVNAALMNWHGYGMSDRGRYRPRNEDAFVAHAHGRIYGVADGMGGHAAGDVASRLVIQVLTASFDGAPPALDAATLIRDLTDSFNAANDAIFDHARVHPECTGMGTTLTALVPVSRTAQCAIAHIGDSRVYLLRDGTFTQLTHDHSWVQEQVDAGRLTPQQARHHPHANTLSRVLGMTPPSEIDTFVVDSGPGDLFMLCTDGLTKMLEDDILHEIVGMDQPLERRARLLIDTANERGGADNITVVLVEAVVQNGGPSRAAVASTQDSARQQSRSRNDPWGNSKADGS